MWPNLQETVDLLNKSLMKNFIFCAVYIIFLIIKFQSKNPFEKLALSNFDTRIMKVVQTPHHQSDIRFGVSRGVQSQCSYMSLMWDCWTLFKSVSIWEFFDLNFILQKGDLLFNSLNNYRYLGTEDLPQELFIRNLSINVEFINNKIGEITATAYLVSTTEIVSDCQADKHRSSVDYQ